MAYLNRLKDLEVGRVYTPHKDVKRKSPGHWHNNYFMPLERVTARHVKAISINQEKGVEISDSQNWSDFVQDSLFKDVTDETVVLKKVLIAIFKNT